MSDTRLAEDSAERLLRAGVVLAALGLAVSVFLPWNNDFRGEAEIAFLSGFRSEQVLLAALAAAALGARRSFGWAAAPGVLALVLLGFHYLEAREAEERERAYPLKLDLPDLPELPELPELPNFPTNTDFLQLQVQSIQWRYGFAVALGCALLVVGCAVGGALRRRRGWAAGPERLHALGMLVLGLALTTAAKGSWWKVVIRYPGSSRGEQALPTLMISSTWGTSFALAALTIVLLSVIALVITPRGLPWIIVPTVLAVAFAVLSHFQRDPCPVSERTTQPGFYVGSALLLATAAAATFEAVRSRGGAPRGVRHTVSRPHAVIITVIGLLLAGVAFLPNWPMTAKAMYLTSWGIDEWSGQLVVLCGLAAVAVGLAAAAGRTRPASALIPAGLATGVCLTDIAQGTVAAIDFESGDHFWEFLLPDPRFVLVTILTVALLLIVTPWKIRPATPHGHFGPWAPPSPYANHPVPPYPAAPAYLPVPPPAPAPFPASPPVRSDPGLLAGRYRLLEHIGQGGMGSVWRARDETLRLEVALKEVVFPPSLREEQREQLRERAMREARALAQLRSHSSVVTVHDILVEDGRPWLVMELVDGRSLAEIIEEEGALDPAGTARLGLALLDALTAAHRVGVLHRDVKPGNVLISQDGRVVLTDFGIATQEGETSLTLSGMLIGSPGYIAPERLREEQDGPEADLWSLGATLYHAVEGEPAYRASQPAVLLAAVLTEEPAPSQKAGPLLPALTGMLQRDPAARWAPDQIRTALQPIAEAHTADTPEA